MALTTILVHLNHEERARELAGTAAILARRNGAHVIGLYVMPPLFIAADMVFPMPGDVISLQIEQQKKQAERIRRVFEDATAGQPLVAEWRVRDDSTLGGGTVATAVIEEAHAADLVVASQALPAAQTMGITDVPERVALESGRPVLVVPVDWTPAEVGHKVVAGWSETREAARAAFDGLMVYASDVEVRLVHVARGASEKKRPAAMADIAATMARHGIRTTAELVVDDGSVAHALLARAGREKADLLVLGAYGHSRLRELVLGGTTREVLKHMTVPVLMSH